MSDLTKTKSVKGRSTHGDFSSAHDNCNANAYDVDKQDEGDDVCEDEDEDGWSDNGGQDEFNVKVISTEQYEVGRWVWCSVDCR